MVPASPSKGKLLTVLYVSHSLIRHIYGLSMLFLTFQSPRADVVSVSLCFCPIRRQPESFANSRRADRGDAGFARRHRVRNGSCGEEYTMRPRGHSSYLSVAMRESGPDRSLLALSAIAPRPHNARGDKSACRHKVRPRRAGTDDPEELPPILFPDGPENTDK